MRIDVSIERPTVCTGVVTRSINVGSLGNEWGQCGEAGVNYNPAVSECVSRNAEHWTLNIEHWTLNITLASGLHKTNHESPWARFPAAAGAGAGASSPPSSYWSGVRCGNSLGASTCPVLPTIQSMQNCKDNVLTGDHSAALILLWSNKNVSQRIILCSHYCCSS